MILFSSSNFLFFILLANVIYFVTYYVYKTIFSFDLTLEEEKPFEFSSSVWCHVQSNEKLCTFKNLCYNSNNKFLFILTDNSVIAGLKREDFKTIGASSLPDHNGMHLQLSLVNGGNNVLKNSTLLEETLFLLWRFKPDNIMHVIHDDLLPLYFTYSYLCEGEVPLCTSNYRLTFVDDFQIGPYLDWYYIFSKSNPFSLSELSNGKTVCFRHSRVGMLTGSRFFQYGFNRPQGPLKSDVTVTFLERFSEFVLNHFNLKPVHLFDVKKCTFVSRKINRKILNDNYMEHQIRIFSNRFGLVLEKVDVSSNTTKELLATLSSSKLLIGMHGSAMILSIFLPKGSTVLEMFPFGIHPEHVSPLWALSNLSESNFNYFSWVNKNEMHSLPHPEYPPVLGGIKHLPIDVQHLIKDTKNVPAVECCQNPIYLYRMYQDTFIDESIIQVLKHIFAQLGAKDMSDNKLLKKWYFPGPVNKINCNFNKDFVIVTWQKPINLENRGVYYKIAVASTAEHFSLSTHSTYVSLKRNLKPGEEIKLWISSVVEGAESIDTYKMCTVI